MLLQNFIPLLREHCLGRLLGARDDAGNPREFSIEELDGIRIGQERLYKHQVIRFNYTTYDMRRDQDSVNPRTHPDILLRSPHDSDDHPYSYARVLGIFHAMVSYHGPGSTHETRKPRRLDLLWVRWFEYASSHPSGFQHRALPRVFFPDALDPDEHPFGFVDPDLVIRASYLMPAWDHGKTSDEYLATSKLARQDTDDTEDFQYYYVCM